MRISGCGMSLLNPELKLFPIPPGWSEPVPGRDFHPRWTSAFSRRTVIARFQTSTERDGCHCRASTHVGKIIVSYSHF